MFLALNMCGMGCLSWDRDEFVLESRYTHAWVFYSPLWQSLSLCILKRDEANIASFYLLAPVS